MAYTQIGEYRWEGWDAQSLATVIRDMRGGNGSENIGHAVDMVGKAAKEMVKTEEELREQLGKLGIAWQSREASGIAQDMVNTRADAMGENARTVDQSAATVGRFGEDFDRTKHGMPEPEKLTPDYDLSPIGMAKNGFQTMTGHTSDYVQQSRDTQAAHDQAVHGLNRYTEASREGLAGYRPLPQPPQTRVSAAPVQGAGSGAVQGGGGNTGVPYVGGTTASSYSAAPAGPGYASSGAAGAAGAWTGASPAYGGAAGGGGSAGGGASGGAFGGGAAGGGSAGGGAPDIGPPEKYTGVGPLGSGAGARPTGFPAAARGAGALYNAEVALAAGAAGATGGIAGGAESGRVVRGRRGRSGARGSAEEESRGRARGPGAGEPEEGRAGRAGGRAGPVEGGRAGAAEGAPARGGRAIAGAASEEAAAARAAERLGARGKPATPLMQPATGSSRGEDDTEHVRKYGIDGDDVFNPSELVAPPVLGVDGGTGTGDGGDEDSGDEDGAAHRTGSDD